MPQPILAHHPTDRASRTHKRSKCQFDIVTLDESRRSAQRLFHEGQYLAACDLYEILYVRFPEQAIELLAELYDLYQTLPKGVGRYTLYQARLFDFQFEPTDRVLDIGSGNDPFPLATHLADIALEDNAYGRAGAPLRRAGTKPIYECDLENMSGFRDKEFDFVYCSHVLEHVRDPAKACEELMRIGKRGFIETPTRGKDLWLGTAAVSNHRWAVENVHDCLIFSEYEPHEIVGLQCDLLLRMHVAPESRREKALTALMYLKAELINTMLMWRDSFAFEVRPAGTGWRSPESHRHAGDMLDDRWNNSGTVTTHPTRSLDEQGVRTASSSFGTAQGLILVWL
jgi:SAM-dependent methyltransferase